MSEEIARSDAEEWRDVPGHPGRRASSWGCIQGPRGVVRGSLDQYGYRWSWAGREWRTKRVQHHLLVALAFIGPRPEGYELDHIDGDKTNNRPENLEYVTHAENMRRMMTRLGRVKPPEPPRVPRVPKVPRSAHGTARMAGATNGRSRLTEQQAREILAKYTRRPVNGRCSNPNGISALAKRYGVGKVTISDLVNGRTWLHLHAPTEPNPKGAA